MYRVLGYDLYFTAPFKNMRTLKFKARPTNEFFATVNQKFGGLSQLPTMLSESWSMIWFDYRALGSSWKLGGVAQHLIDGSEKLTCPLISVCYWKVQLQLYCGRQNRNSLTADAVSVPITAVSTKTLQLRWSWLDYTCFWLAVMACDRLQKEVMLREWQWLIDN